MTELNSTAAALLGFLQGGDASGYELWNIARDLIGDFWTVTRSQVYRELAALNDHGLVQAQPTGQRSRRPYRLTAEGRAAFAAWLAQPPGLEQIRYPLLLTMAFGSSLDPDTLLGYAAAHRPVHEERLADYQKMAAAGGLDRYQLATLSFGLHYEQAVLAWMDGLPALLTQAGLDR
jgi:DNA-binding PadR family transcriptional regulator